MEEQVTREEFEALEKRVSGLEQIIQSQMKLNEENEENFDQVLKLISSDRTYMDSRLKWVITFAVSITALGIAVCVLL